MSEENRKIADHLSNTDLSRESITKALDKAYERGKREGLETHKAGCTIAYELGAREMRERLIEACAEHDGSFHLKYCCKCEERYVVLRSLPLTEPEAKDGRE